MRYAVKIWDEDKSFANLFSKVKDKSAHRMTCFTNKRSEAEEEAERVFAANPNLTVFLVKENPQYGDFEAIKMWRKEK